MVKTYEGDLAHPITLKGEVTGWDASDVAQFGTLVLSGTLPGESSSALPPLAPTLTGTQPSRTEVDLAWQPGDETGRPAITSWEVHRRSSTDNGVTFTAWAAVTGSPFSAGTLSSARTGLSTGTPEVMWEFRVRGVNGDGVGEWSNSFRAQWNVVIVQAPVAPTNFSLTTKTSTSRSMSWKLPGDATVDKVGLFDDGVLVVDNLDKAANTYTWGGLTPGGTYSGVGVAQHNSAGWGPISNTQTFTQPLTDTAFVAGPVLMGCSNSDYEHGGTEVWDGWRCYTQSTRDKLADRTGSQRPKFLAYSESGPNLGGSTPVYSTVFNHVKDDLESFYYTATGAQSTRWGIQLFWSNGNENFDKGVLSGTLTQAKIDDYTNKSQKALYDACHLKNADGTRRYPDAYAGSNPTHNAEQQGKVAAWLHPSAIYHDFVMWSTYDPGRKVSLNDPTYNWPGLTENIRTNATLGYLARCFYRTNAARDAARQIDPTHDLMFGQGEGSNGVDPDDPDTRPYWTVYAFAAGMAFFSDFYNLAMPFACWWDSDTCPSASGTGCGVNNDVSSDGRSRLGYDDSANRSWATNWTGSPAITTRMAWQNWRSYHTAYGGTRPAAWKGYPKASWKTGGSPV